MCPLFRPLNPSGGYGGFGPASCLLPHPCFASEATKLVPSESNRTRLPLCPLLLFFVDRVKIRGDWCRTEMPNTFSFLCYLSLLVGHSDFDGSRIA